MPDATPTTDAPSRPPMRFRRTRIAVSVFFALLAVALCVLWVRSYSKADFFLCNRSRPFRVTASTQRASLLICVGESRGMFPSVWHTLSIGAVDPPEPGVQGFSVFSQDSASISKLNRVGIRFPIWFAVAIVSTVGLLSWHPRQFSLRAMLIATTLTAVVLGLGVWLGS